VNATNLLANAGIDFSKIRVVTTGPAVNVYIRLTGRTTGETVTRTEYLALQKQIATVLRNAADTNSTFTLGVPSVRLFDQVISRPLPAEINDSSFGTRTSEFIGQDSGDVFATLVPGYNFDGLQVPFVQRQGDSTATTTLAAALGGAAGNTTLTVSGLTGFPTVNNFFIQIDSEHMLVTGGAGTTTWTVVRGQNSSPRVAHNASADVKLIPVSSQPNFYGAHGYDPMLENMSAIFYAAGPNVTHSATPIPIMANMDIAPTIMRMLGVPPEISVEGRALNLGPVTNHLVKAASRKQHGAGNFDVKLAVDATPAQAAVECRRAGASASHQIVFTFANAVTSGSASVTLGTAVVSGVTFVGNEMRVALTGVSNAQNVTISFSNVADGATTVSGSVSVAFLQGDVNGDRAVNITDQNETKSLGFSTATVNRSNFRADTVVTGSVNSADLAFVKSQNGTVIP
jgi:hypothetical protein